MNASTFPPAGTTHQGGSLFARLAIMVFVVMSVLFGLGLAASIPA